MRTVFIVFTAFSCVLGISGIVFNFLVCFAYLKNNKLLDAPNVFILNISIGNLLYSIVALPMLAASNSRGRWLFGEAGCTAYGFLTTFFALGSMMNLGAAAYERYITLCKLYDDGEAQFSRTKAVLLSSILWCYSFVWSVLPIFGWSSYVQEGVGTSCSIDWRSGVSGNVSYAVCLIVATFAIPVAATIFCFYKAHQTVHKLSEQAREHWGENSNATQQTIAAESKMARIAVVMTSGYLIAWTPYTIASIVALINPGLVSDIGASIPAYIAKSSACYNPFIFMFMYKKLRDEMMKVFCCGKNPVHPVDGQIGSNISANQTRHQTTKGNSASVAPTA